MTIKARIVLLVILVVVTTTTSIGTLASNRSGEALERFIGAALVNAAVNTIDKLDRMLQELEEDAANWVRAETVVRAALGEVDSDLRVLGALDEIRKSHRGLKGLLVVSSDGKVQAATDARLMGKSLPPEMAALRKELSRPGAYTSPRWLPQVQCRVMLLAAPIELAEVNVTVGELLLLLDFAEVYAIVDAVKVTAEPRPWFLLLDPSGRAIGLPVSLRVKWADRRPLASDIGLSLRGEDLQASSGFTLAVDPATGGRDLIGYARSQGVMRFESTGWTLLYRVSGDDAFAPVYELRRKVLGVGLSLAGVVGFIALLMTLQVVRPLERITRAMQRVHQGDFDVSLQVAASGEVGRLVSAFNFMLQGLKDREFMRDVFSRHVSPAVAEKILSDRDALKLGGERLRATVLFTDIRSFTTLSERLSPPDVVAMLNEYFTEMVEVVFRYDGMVNKYIGDAMMAVWGVPFPVQDAAARAAFAALEMQQRIQAISERRLARGQPAVQMGIGFSTGEVVAGNIGSPQRMEYTVIGDEVNVASRLEGLTKEFGAEVIMSESSYRDLQGLCQAEPLGEVKVKGRQQPITVYRLVSMTIQPEELRGRVS